MLISNIKYFISHKDHWMLAFKLIIKPDKTFFCIVSILFKKKRVKLIFYLFIKNFYCDVLNEFCVKIKKISLRAYKNKKYQIFFRLKWKIKKLFCEKIKFYRIKFQIFYLNL